MCVKGLIKNKNSKTQKKKIISAKSQEKKYMQCHDDPKITCQGSNSNDIEP